MRDADEWDRQVLNARPLTPERWDALKQAAIHRAELARARSMRTVFGKLTAVARRAQRRLVGCLPRRLRPRRPIRSANAATLATM
jgi:hypothetical protein